MNSPAPSGVRDWAFLAIVCAFVLFLLYALGHGFVRDLVLDEMHERGECHFCELYRFVHSDDSAFQTRELRRAAK